LTVRVGKDGRVRPLDSAPGRQRAAELLISSPEASLREVARAAGISPGTVGDVRRRLQRGEQPAPTRPGAGGTGGNAARPRRPSGPTRRSTVPPAPAAVLEKLLRDPSLRHNEMGRWLLRLLQANLSGTQELPAVAAAVPPHCSALMAQLARHYGRVWHGFADELRERMLDIEAHEGARADGDD
jgi:transposase-like protein